MYITGLVLAVLIAGVLCQHSRWRRHKNTHRASAARIFGTFSTQSKDALFQFDGRTAQVVKETEAVEQINGSFLAYTLTRIARNSSGEYFWFYFRTDAPPQIKHIDQARAKVLLKAKYLAPIPDGSAAPDRLPQS